MPTINRQKPPPQTAPKANGRAAVTAAPDAMRGEGIKLLEYGRGKTGKTRLFATFPKPALLIGTEDGTKSICGPTPRQGKKDSGRRLADGTPVFTLMNGGKPTGVDFFLLSKADQLIEAGEMIRDGGYVSAGLDHAGGLYDLMFKEYKGLADVPVQKEWGMAQQQEWGIINAQFVERMARFLDLANTLGIDIAVVAHERNFREDANQSDVMVANVGAALTPKAAAWLNAACDYICQTFIRLKVIEETGTVAGKEVVNKIQTNEPEFCLRVGPHPVFSTGFRLAPGAKLPESISDPSYDKILKVIRGEKL